jgi:hypothetical protein
MSKIYRIAAQADSGSQEMATFERTSPDISHSAKLNFHRANGKPGFTADSSY